MQHRTKFSHDGPRPHARGDARRLRSPYRHGVPELPEIRAHAERLTASHAGAALTRFEPLTFNALKTVTPAPAEAAGRPMIRVSTRGKFLRLEFGEIDFVVHLMQGGRLVHDPAPKKKPRGGLARWWFEDVDALLLTEAGKEHRAGVWVVRAGTDAAPMEGLGPEADHVDAATLAELLRTSTGRLHGWLRDQRHLAGIGRRLANEICWHAQLSPFAAVNKVGADEVTRLHGAIGACIGTSLDDERGHDRMTRSGERPSTVHHRAGEACLRCGDVIRAVEYNAYTVNYCATCQTGGRVLADNTTSKFLK